MVKDGEFQDTYDRDRRANREKKQDKLDIEMIGLVKKEKEKKSNQAIRRRFNGRWMKNAAKPSVLKIVLVAVLSVKPNAKHFKNSVESPDSTEFFIS